jgi:hypothetical protein
MFASEGRTQQNALQENSSGEKEVSEIAGSRAAQLRQRRLKKAENTQTYKKPFWEDYLYNFDQKGNQSLEDSNFWGFYPRVDWIARGSGPALGARFWKPELKGDLDLMGSAFYSWKKYQHYDLRFGILPNRGKKIPSRAFDIDEVERLSADYREFQRFKLYGTTQYRYKPQETFYGQGPDSKKQDRSTYLLEDLTAGLSTGFQITDRIGWTLSTDYVRNDLGPGKEGGVSPTSDENTAPGLSNPPNYLRLTSYLFVDCRDDPGVPHKGFSVAFGWQKWNEVTAPDRFNFYRWGIDARAFIPLGSPQRVLALRALGISSDPAEGNRVPFFLQPSLGGGRSLRGYESYRFRDDKLMLFQGEYRWEASRRWELALFGDTGTVAATHRRLSLSKLKSDWGIGLRLKTSRRTLFRIDRAWSNEGSRTLFRVSAVF